MKKILIVNQVFYPDEVAVSQYVSSYAFESVKKGNAITVYAGNHDYENPEKIYPSHSTESDVTIERLWSTGFSKRTKSGRLLNFLTFQLSLTFKLLFINRKKFDIVLGCTVPPLVPIVTSLFCFLHRLPFLFWVMDLQPDEAIAAGYLKENSLAKHILSRVSMLPLKIAKSIIVLDIYMKERLCKKNISSEKIHVVGLWSVLENKSISDTGKQFRFENNFGNKVVVMYSGNHSVCHPLDTLLEAAKVLQHDERFLFVFIGSGVRKKDITAFIKSHSLTNILQLPYQPMDRIGESLNSADIHCVVQGDLFTGLVHPSKIYGILACGKPFIYIGPNKGHINDIINDCGCGIHVYHGDAEKCVTILKYYANLTTSEKQILRSKMNEINLVKFSKLNQISKLNDIVNKK